MPDEQEAGFTFVDRRSNSETPEGAPSTDAEEISAGGATPSAESAESDSHPSASPFQMPHLSATDRVLMCINWLHEGAWIALGLVQDPATEKIEKDLEGARMAIDSIAFLVEKVDPSLDAPTRRELMNLVRDLRLNFVQQQARP